MKLWTAIALMAMGLLYSKVSFAAIPCPEEDPTSCEEPSDPPDTSEE